MDENFWESQNENQKIITKSFTSVPYWLKKSGYINLQMQELLEVPDDTYVRTNHHIKYFVGARCILYEFGNSGRPHTALELFSDFPAWYKEPDTGVLLGKKVKASH